MQAFLHKMNTVKLPVRWVILVLYVGVLTLVLLQSSSEPVVGPVAPKAYDLGWDMLLTTGHIVGFTLLVSMIWWAFLPVSTSTRGLVIGLVFAAVLGMVTELLQTLVPDRSASWFDLLVDWGVALATMWAIRRWIPHSV